jgi:hypothetical protein
LMLSLIALALLARAALPAGWMPTFAGGAIQISVCSGESRSVMWLDKAGKTHKSDPSGGDHKDSPCAFASVAPGVDVPMAQPTAYPKTDPMPNRLHQYMARVGQGLAAPPPPQTGPPLLI